MLPLLPKNHMYLIHEYLKETGFNILGFADDHQISKPFQVCDQIPTPATQLKYVICH